MTALEVWGDPIAHSKSPLIHAAAYAELGWDWSYGRRQVAEPVFTRDLAAHGAALHGLSLTYPLKTAAFEAAATRDRFAELTGAVNTYLLTDSGPHGFNTDAPGMVADLREHGIDAVERARIVGAGATATSALVALADLGADRVDVIARRPDAARPLVALGERVGVRVEVTPMDAVASSVGATSSAVPITISALPGGTVLAHEVTTTLAATGGLLYDVVYGNWPTALATAWQGAGGTAMNGLGMLLQQAARQIRIFAAGDADEPLPREDVVVGVMRRALMGD